MILIVSKYLIPKGFTGFAVYPFVILKHIESKKNLTMLNHERIHLRQQLELLIIPFFIWYSIEFLIKYFKYRDWKMAYNNISFEREAYQNEKDLYYDKQRSFYKFLNYI